METRGPEEFSRPVPILAPGVALCNKISRSKWYLKAVTLRNNEGVDVAKALCQNVDTALVDDNDGMALGDGRVIVHIAESLSEDDFPTGQM